MSSNNTERLEPIIDWIGDFPVTHGERGDLDPEHSLACLCGFPGEYLMCPESWDGEGTLLGATISKGEEGAVHVYDANLANPDG